MRSFLMHPGVINLIGRRGENEHRMMMFDVSDYIADTPNATFTLLHRLPSGGEAYPVAAVEHDQQYVYWTVTSGDVSVEGEGMCQLIIRDGDEIGKTVYYPTRILPALDGSEEPPEPWASWQELFSQMRDEAVEARNDAEAAADETASNAQIALDAAVDAIAARDRAVLAETNAGTYAAGAHTDRQATEEARNSAEVHANRADAASDLSENYARAACECKTAAEAAQGASEAARNQAGEYASNAYRDAERAEQAAENAGWMEFHIDERGHLIYTRVGMVDVDFALVDGHLVMEVD